MAEKRMIFSGHAIHIRTSERAQLSVYHLGGLRYELHRLGRPMTNWTAPAAIDKHMVAREFVREYSLRDVVLEPILPTRSEGQR